MPTALCLALLTVLLPAGIDTWQSDFDATLEQAAAEKRVVFVAVNMDGERANDRMVERVYTDKRVAKLAAHTVNVVASQFEHSKPGKPCSRLGTVTCAQHRSVDLAVRERVLAPDEDGYVVAPQHVFLAPDGGVILSVPYEVSAAELEWCFVAALKANDPAFDEALSPKARAPKRLLMGEVFQTGQARAATPPTREEALELIEKMKRGLPRDQATQAARRLVAADEPEARAYVLQMLRSSNARGGGGGRRGGGGGGGGGEDRRAQLVHWIGRVSPQSYWEVCAEVAGAAEEELRAEAVVALEQLAAPKALKVLFTRLSKEENPAIKKDILRAIGTSGVDDKRARKTLLKFARADRDGVLRANAILGLGSLAAHADTDAFLKKTLSEAVGRECVAAVLALGVSRDGRWIEVLEPLTGDGTAGDGDLKTAVEASLSVLNGGAIEALEGPITKVAGDEIARERFFGRKREGEGRRQRAE